MEANSDHSADQAGAPREPSSLLAEDDDVEVVSLPDSLPLDLASRARRAEASSNSDDGEPEDDDDDDNGDVCRYNEGVPSPTSAATAAAATRRIQYDPRDHTQAAPSASQVKRRVWVLPRALLPPIAAASLPLRAADAASAAHDCCRGDDGVSSTRTSTQSTSAGAGAVRSAEATVSLSSSFSPSAGGRGSVGAAAGGGGGAGGGWSATQQLPARAVRVPHPRHGQPALYLVHSDPPPVPTASSPPSSSSLLFEIQAQAPPDDFALSWFVGEAVIPSRPHSGELLLVTPVDLTFFAIHELLGDATVYERLSHKFMPAGDLYRSGEGHADASRTSNRHVEETHPEKDAYVPLFGRIGGAGQESSQSSSSSPYSYSFPNAHPITDDRRQRDASHEAAELPLSVSPHGTPHPAHSNPLNTAAAVSDKGWCGWAHAAMRYPLLFHACFAALQSDTVLRRLCEVREVGGEAGNGSGGSSARDMYYRPSEAVAVAWLKRKVELLRGSSVLREVLQLSEVTTTTAGAASTPSSSSSSPSTATAVHSLPQQVSATSTTPASKAAAEVPLAIAFGMVAEYVPERLHDPLAVACGLPDPSLPSSVSSVVTPSAGAKRGREGEGSSSAMPSAERNPASGGTPSAGPKSASVRRLERAGRPKGTPTLFSMFAKKPKDGA